MARRPDTWWPASDGISAKTIADDAEISATTMKAGPKSEATRSEPLRINSVSSTENAPTATPAEMASCWVTLTSVVARLMRAMSTSA